MISPSVLKDLLFSPKSMSKGLKVPLFLFFWHLCLNPVLCFVSPPDNVTVSCHNFENVLYWNYNDTSPQPKFIVTVQDYEGNTNISVTTAEKHLNITEYTQDIDVYRVSVKVQLNGSEASSSGTLFSYSNAYPSDSTCVVDFPEINVLASQHTVEFSFKHPSDIYDIEDLYDSFEVTVMCNETECGMLDCNFEEQCKRKIDLPENLYGGCFDAHLKGSVSNVPLETSVEVCCLPRNPIKADVEFVIGVTCFATVLLIAIVTGVMYKNLTQSKPQIAAISRFLGIFPRSSEPSVINPESPALSQLTGVSHTPLLFSNEDFLSISATPTPEEVTDIPVCPDPDEQPHEENDSTVSEQDEDPEDFPSTSGYDCKKFVIEMSPEDDVEAYRP